MAFTKTGMKNPFKGFKNPFSFKTMVENSGLKGPALERVKKLQKEVTTEKRKAALKALGIVGGAALTAEGLIRLHEKLKDKNKKGN